MASQRFVRFINERRALTFLRVDGPMPRAELARRLSVTRATMTSIVDGLLSRDLLREDGRRPIVSTDKPELGRPGIDVSINPAGAFMLGVEIGVGILRFALLDLSGGVAERHQIAMPPDAPPTAAVAEIAKYLTSLRARKRYRGLIVGLGATVPGLVRQDGLVVHLPILKWKDVPLRKILSDRTNIEVTVENSANAAAFGEMYTSAGLRRDSIVYLKLGDGCGGAWIMNGRLLRGSVGTAAEMGHIRIAETGPTCSCGRVGCLETFVNLDALHRYYFGEGSRRSDPDLPTTLVGLIESGDARALAAADELQRQLGQGLISLVNVFNPSEIVLGGRLAPLLRRMTAPLQAEIASGIVPGMLPPSVSLTTLGEYECAIGAATIVHHKQFDVSNIDIETDA